MAGSCLGERGALRRLRVAVQPSEDVVAEIAEFSYHEEARLVLLPRRNPGVPRHVHVSAGQLWTTGGEWAWRVWSITRSGEITFSEMRTFVH